MKLDKKGFQISSYVMAVVVFTIVIVSGLGIVYQFTAVDSNFIPDAQMDRFNNSFNKFDDVKRTSNVLEKNITESKSEPSVYGVLDGLVTTGWSSIRATFASITFMATSLGDISEYIGIDPRVLSLIGFLIIIGIAYGIFRLIFQTEV